MQNISALTGGIRSPGVALGATMDGTYAATPEGISNANNLAIQKDASAPILYQDRNGNTFYAPKNAPPVGSQPAPTGTDQVKAQAERQYLFQPGNLQTQTAPVNPANPITVPGYNGTFTRAQAAAASDSDQSTPGTDEWDAAASAAASGQPPLTPLQITALGLDKGKQTPRPVTADERKAWNLPATGSFTIAPGEAPKEIAGTGGAGNAPPAALIGADGRPVDENLTGPGVLKSVPPNVGSRQGDAGRRLRRIDHPRSASVESRGGGNPRYSRHSEAGRVERGAARQSSGARRRERF
jgi:hypothetical protein